MGKSLPVSSLSVLSSPLFSLRNSYIINLLCNDVLMTLEVEDEDTCERWSGEFTAQCKSQTIDNPLPDCCFISIPSRVSLFSH